MRRALLALLALLLVGCADAGPPPQPPAATGATPPATAPAPIPPLEPARCTPDAGANCTAHTGRVITVESVDPDGDGDLHVITAGGSVTAPGITILDVSRALRPEQDPRPGDRVTGAGPVYRGSFRQRQIEVTTFGVARAPG